MGTEVQTCKILQLSDCTMMYILSYLDATSLFNLSRTCLYFKNITEDPQLWRYIEARHEPNTTKKVQYVCDRVHDRTTHLFLRAENRYSGLVPQNFLLSLNGLENLTILALENQWLDGRTLTLSDFPKTLEELSLKKTHVKNGKLFFQVSYHTMRKLRVLILDECDWVDSNFFMSVAKYESLEILSVVKCMTLHLNVIPYLSVARHGCKKLKIIDCRFNTVGNEILRTFDSHNLLALYFQSMRSYQFDTGIPFMNCPPLLNEYRDLISQSTIKNRSLEQYKYIIGDLIEELPESVLYHDPYPECACGYKDQINGEPILLSNEATKPKTQPKPPLMPVDDFIDFHLSPQRFICRRHVKELNKLPKDFKNFFYQNQKKFYPDSSDNDSDSDDDRDCCMFGVGKSPMIVLKVREVDEQGNMPEPEVINLSPPERNVINIDIDINQGRVVQRRSDFDRADLQPSTSRQDPDNSSSETVQRTAKRKAEGEGHVEDEKKAKLDEAGSSSRHSDPSESDTSKRKSENSQNRNNTSDCESNGEIDGSSSDSSPKRSVRPVPSQPHKNIANAGRSKAPAGPPEVPAGPSRGQAIPVAPIEIPRREDCIRVVQLPINDLLQNADNLPKKIKLRRLALRGYTEITDEALFNLRNLSLDLLDVTYTGVTREGIEKFLTLNPDCRVIHKDYCVCRPRIPC